VKFDESGQYLKYYKENLIKPEYNFDAEYLNQYGIETVYGDRVQTSVHIELLKNKALDDRFVTIEGFNYLPSQDSILNIVHWKDINADFDTLHAVLSGEDKKVRLIANNSGKQEMLKTKNITSNSSIQIVGSYTKI
jgi:hypothetical protein